MAKFQRGFSLFSLSIALAVTAIVMGTAVPSFERFNRQWALARGAQALVASLHQARSAATARALPVALCQTDGPGHCGAAASALQGWQLFTEPTVSSPPRFETGDELLQVHWLPAGVELRATRTAVTYWPAARAGTTSTFVFCDARNLVAPRAVIVSQTGRPRLSARMADGSAPDCSHG